MINSIQCLRGVAAIAVVIYHLNAVQLRYFSDNILPWFTTYGYLGVQIFFMISGFIMMYILDQRKFLVKPFEFLRARLIRIVPTYWLITLLIFIVAQIYPNLVNSSYTSKPSLAKSLLFIPQETNPWLNVGWSLEYEVFFYVIIAVLLICASSRHLKFLLVTTLLIVALPLKWTSNSIIDSFLDPIVLWFVIGVIIQVFWKNYNDKNFKYILLVLPLSALTLAYENRFKDFDMIMLHFVLVCVFCSALLIEEHIPKQMGRVFDYFGKISYSLYLTHVLSLNISLIFLTRFMKLQNPIMVNFLTLLFVIFIALVFYEEIEKKFQSIIRRYND